MVHADPKVQAVLDYLGAAGGVMLLDPWGLPIAFAGDDTPAPEPQRLVVIEPLPVWQEVPIHAHKLCFFPTPNISPRAVAERVERGTALLRALLPAPAEAPSSPPRRGGGGGPGPASAELRVWPPSRRARN